MASEAWRDDVEIITEVEFVDADNKAGDDGEEVLECDCRGVEDSEGVVRRCTDDSCFNRYTKTECVRCRKGCMNQRITKKQCAKIEVFETDGKGYGLRSLDDLSEGDFIIEYLGEVVSHQEMNRRFQVAKAQRHVYVLSIGRKRYIDARHKCSIGRFINHSCEPNCRTEIWTVGGELRVGIFAIKTVKAGEELTFDYKWQRSLRTPTKCLCGTPSCRGFLELMDNKQAENFVNSRKGRWRQPNRDEIGEALVNKQVKILWDGNRAFFYAEVLSFDEESKLHLVRYSDGTQTKEALQEGSRKRKADFRLLDESMEEILIRKRVVDPNVFISGQNNDANEDEDASSNMFAIPVSEPERAKKRIYRKIVEFHHMFASYLSGDGSGNLRKLTSETSCRIKFYDREREAVPEISRKAVLLGTREDINVALARLESLEEDFNSSLEREKNKRHMERMEQQGWCMTNEWVFRLPDSSSTQDDDDNLRIANNTVLQPHLAALMQKTLALLKLPASVHIHAHDILRRTIALCPNNADMVTHTTTLVVSTIVLVLKCRSAYKPHKLTQILQAAFQAQHGQKVKSQAQLYQDIYVSVESEQLNMLGYDLYSCDMCALLMAHLGCHPWLSVLESDVASLSAMALPLWLLYRPYLNLAAAAVLVAAARSLAHTPWDPRGAPDRPMAMDQLLKVFRYSWEMSEDGLHPILVCMCAQLQAAAIPAATCPDWMKELDDVSSFLSDLPRWYRVWIRALRTPIGTVKVHEKNCSNSQESLSRESSPRPFTISRAPVYPGPVYRSPWLSDQTQHTIQPAEAHVIAILAQDLFAAYVSTDALKGVNATQALRALRSDPPSWFWEPLCIPFNGQGGCSELSTEQIRVCLRRWPIAQDDKFELKRFAKASVPIVTSPCALNELFLFQHIHAHTRVQCRSIIIPLALVPLNEDRLLSSMRNTPTSGRRPSPSLSSESAPHGAGGTPGFQSDEKYLEESSETDLFTDEKVEDAVTLESSEHRQPRQAPPEPKLYMVIPPVELSLAMIIPEIGRKRLSPDLSAGLCRDLISAARDLSSSGVFLKWIDPNYVYLTSDGILQIGSLSGAVLSSMLQPSNSTARPQAPELKARTFPYIHTCSPEVLLDDEITASSTMWAVGCICVLVLTGKNLFKSDKENTLVEHMYRVCGTPKHALEDFETHLRSLPYYKHLWLDQGGAKKSYKPRVEKTIADVLREKDEKAVVVDFLASMLRLHPSQRTPAAELLGHEFLQDKEPSHSRCRAMQKFRERIDTSVHRRDGDSGLLKLSRVLKFRTRHKHSTDKGAVRMDGQHTSEHKESTKCAEGDDPTIEHKEPIADGAGEAMQDTKALIFGAQNPMTPSVAVRPHTHVHSNSAPSDMYLNKTPETTSPRSFTPKSSSHHSPRQSGPIVQSPPLQHTPISPHIPTHMPTHLLPLTSTYAQPPPLLHTHYSIEQAYNQQIHPPPLHSHIHTLMQPLTHTSPLHAHAHISPPHTPTYAYPHPSPPEPMQPSPPKLNNPSPPKPRNTSPRTPTHSPILMNPLLPTTPERLRLYTHTGQRFPPSPPLMMTMRPAVIDEEAYDPFYCDAAMQRAGANSSSNGNGNTSHATCSVKKRDGVSLDSTVDKRLRAEILSHPATSGSLVSAAANKKPRT